MRQRRLPTIAMTAAAAAMALSAVACEVENGDPIDDPIIDDPIIEDDL